MQEIMDMQTKAIKNVQSLLEIPVRPYPLALDHS
jgi:hypothetical protein